MLTIRNMTESDVDAIAFLEKQAFPDAWTSQSIHDTFCQRQAFIVVAEDDGKTVGYCIVYHVLDEGEIARVAVDSSCRRQGVGRKILDQVSDICAEKGVTRLLLDVRESNVAARTFYQSYGFQEDGIRKNFYDTPKEHAVLMSKVLG